MSTPTRALVARTISLLSRAAPLLALALCALPALAQESSELRPPNPGTIKGPVSVLVYIVVALMAGLIIFAATLPSKRGHQD
ncbi:MAG: hypothetical protein ACF8Q5_12825 [Phycisphaerales bacterium JB040]